MQIPLHGASKAAEEKRLTFLTASPYINNIYNNTKYPECNNPQKTAHFIGWNKKYSAKNDH